MLGAHLQSDTFDEINLVAEFNSVMFGRGSASEEHSSLYTIPTSYDLAVEVKTDDEE